MNTTTSVLEKKIHMKDNAVTIKRLKMNRSLFIMLIPGVVYYIIFKYIPLFGSAIAFQDYNIFKGFFHSQWVGFEQFKYIFSSDSFITILINNLIISFYQIIFSFPAPILLALLLNEVRNMTFKRSIQTAVYLPHFLSWAIVSGIVYMLLSSQTGIVNGLLKYLGLINNPVEFLQNAKYIRGIIVAAGIWKEAGWGTIIFLATLTSISPTLYEAAKIDGANRFKQCIHVTIPGLMPAIVTLLLLKVGNIMDLGFEAVYPFVNPISASKAQVLDTYTYVAGVVGGQYSMTTAIGLFKSIIGFTLLLITNKISKAVTGEGII